MKVIKEKSREYKGKEYFKYKVNLPERILKEAKIKYGEELEVEVKNNEIIIRKKSKH